MIRKFVTSLLLVLTVCLSAWANQQFNIDLGTKDGEKTQIVAINGFARFVFTYEGKNDKLEKYKISMTVENSSNTNPVIIFNNEYDVKKIKKLEKAERDKKKNIQFEKTANGTTSGFSYQRQPMVLLEGNESITYHFEIAANTNNRQTITLPIYYVSIKDKRYWIFFKKQVYELLYPEIAQFDIQVAGWSEDDPTYQDTKAKVDNFKKKLQKGIFCSNKYHPGTISEQRAPFQKEKDDLIAKIDGIIKANGYMDDEPRRCYDALKKELQDIDLKDNYYIKKKCPSDIPPPPPTCKYCNSYNESKVYHLMEDTYIQMHNGNITKAQAKNKVSGPYNCYTKHKSKSSKYQNKINDYYNRIVK